MSVSSGIATVLNKINEYKKLVEGKIVGAFWKQPELLLDYSDVKLSDFVRNEWKVFYQIIYDLYVVEQKIVIDEVVVGIYLEKHLKLKEKYEQYGGYDTIDVLSNEFTKIDNIHSDVAESNKWNTVLKLIKYGFPVNEEKLAEFVDKSLDDIYDEYETVLNHIFIKANNDIESYDISDGIDELFDELNNGNLVGLEYCDMPLLTSLTNGCSLGNITVLGAPSGSGKSSFLRNSHMTSCLKKGERIVIMINEEGKKKWQREFICWVANNIYKQDLQKHTITNGKYTEENAKLIKKCIDWIKGKKEDRYITLVPFKGYQTSLALKTIRKYTSMGIKYFALDTFKADKNSSGDDWALLEKNMVDIYDLIKEENKNVHIFVTIQLKLSDIRARYLTLDNTAKAKGIAEVVSTFIMLRRVFDDEYPGKTNALKVYRSEGKIQPIVELSADKKYYLAFIVKNRDGESGYRQIVFENDLSRNIMKEIGYTNVGIS